MMPEFHRELNSVYLPLIAAGAAIVIGALAAGWLLVTIMLLPSSTVV
jgi:hypothetical protein